LALNRLGQYASSPGPELTVSILAVVIAGTLFVYQRMDGQAELAWVVD